MRRQSAVAAVGLAVLALAGCGGGRSGLTAVEQNQLLGLIAQARSQATAGRPTTALNTLTTLRDRVSALRREGVLDPQRAARMQSVAAQAQSAVRAQIAAAKPKPAAVPASPPSVVATPAAPTNPAQIIVQDAKGLQQRAQHALGKEAGKLRQKLDKLGNGGGGNEGG